MVVERILVVAVLALLSTPVVVAAPAPSGSTADVAAPLTDESPFPDLDHVFEHLAIGDIAATTTPSAELRELAHATVEVLDAEWQVRRDLEIKRAIAVAVAKIDAGDGVRFALDADLPLSSDADYTFARSDAGGTVLVDVDAGEDAVLEALSSDTDRLVDDGLVAIAELLGVPNEVFEAKKKGGPSCECPITSFTQITGPIPSCVTGWGVVITDKESGICAVEGCGSPRPCKALIGVTIQDDPDDPCTTRTIMVPGASGYHYFQWWVGGGLAIFPPYNFEAICGVTRDIVFSADGQRFSTITITCNMCEAAL